MQPLRLCKRRTGLTGALDWGGFDETSNLDLVVERLEPREMALLWERLTVRLGRRVDFLRLK